jgi:hypothetical protein
VENRQFFTKAFAVKIGFAAKVLEENGNHALYIEADFNLMEEQL